MLMRRGMAVAAVCGAVLAIGDSAAATTVDAFPSKPVRFIVTFSPGGGTDTFARAVAQKLSEAWGQPVIVDNRAGGNGNIGAHMVARAPNDGYTIALTTNATISINPQLYKLPYDPVQDFSPVSLLATVPFVLLAHPSLPVRSVADLIKYAKSRPGTLNYASSGNGGGSHLSAELLNRMANIDLNHVPYKGGAPALADIVGGHVQIMFSTVLTGTPHIRASRLRGLAVTGPRRSPVLPEVPAMSETPGLEGFETDLWYGMLAPAKTDPRIVGRIYAETRRALSHPDLVKRFEPSGTQIVGSTSKQFSQTIRDDIAKWSRIIKTADIKVE